MTDPIPSFRTQKEIRDAVYVAQALHGRPVGYDDIRKELKDVSMESLSRYLRSLCKIENSGIEKVGNGYFQVRKLRYQNSIGRFC